MSPSAYLTSPPLSKTRKSAVRSNQVSDPACHKSCTAVSSWAERKRQLPQQPCEAAIQAPFVNNLRSAARSCGEGRDANAVTACPDIAPLFSTKILLLGAFVMMATAVL